MIGRRPWLRRAVTIPMIGSAFLLLTALLPLLVIFAVIFDVLRRLATGTPMMCARLLVGVWIYLGAEVCGTFCLGAAWLLAGVGPRRRVRLLDLTYAIQEVWVSSLFRMIVRFLDLRFEVDGDADVRPAPALILIQHASLLDTLLPTALLTARHGVRLRFVLKKELLVSPCLDVAGHILPNAFVDRSSQESGAELARIARLAEALGPDDAVIIYPEGTRYTPERRERALARLRASNPALAERAEELRHVLPPRLGGVLTLLDAAPELDVVLVAHHGLEGFAVLEDVTSGAVLGHTVRVLVRRIPRADIPSDTAGRVHWLLDQWRRIDGWVETSEWVVESPVEQLFGRAK